MKLRYIASGALASALLALSCCIGPLLFMLFGVSMASFSFLSVLAPWQPFFQLLGIALLMYGWVYYYRRRLCLRNHRWVFPSLLALSAVTAWLLYLPYMEFE